jgi:hypothetical protein
MRPRKSSSASAAVNPGEGADRPDVILDVRFEQGLLFLALINISDVPAYRVSVRFEKKFRGLGGECEVSALRLFRRVEFLAPHKRIETLLDSSRAYFQRREPTVIKARLAFRDAGGKPHQREVVHDLAIYKTVSYVVNREPLVSSPLPANAPCATSPPPEKESTYGNLKRQSLLQFQLPR